ncbi:hypothetical protein FJTKL_07408 [Diaporthe vaccinii]|uniref:Uncharacterized protein n=1 Tax=Diaporthe vaccinii TaxID=105482 RepID=A0ABR4ETZ9_9PEZI
MLIPNSKPFTVHSQSSLAPRMAAPHLPDFVAMGEHLNGLGDQLQRFANVPAMHEGHLLQELIQQNHNILQQLVTLTHRVDGLNDRVDGLSNKFDQLQNRVMAEHHNSLSRIANNRLPTPEHLEGLHNVLTNELIPQLPTTVQGIQSLNMYNATRILEELGQEPSGNLAARKRRILLELGVTQQLTLL